VGAPLAGFAARQGVSNGIHDDLFSRALVLVSDEAAIAIVSVDVLALPGEFVDRVRAAIQNEIGLPPTSVMIAATHTHAGPVTITTFFNPDESVNQHYMNLLAGNITESVTEAWRKRFSARVGVGVGHVEGVGVNRRSADQRPVDEEIGIIKVEDENRDIRAVLINYACHPTVLGPDNLLVTGDFPAFALNKIEEAMGPGGFAMFLNGTQGNISMGHSSELSAIGVVTPGRTFERAAELGQLLAAATQEALPSINTAADAKLGAATISIELPLKKYPRPEETLGLMKAAEDNLAETIADGHPVENLRRAKSEHLYASITNFYAKETHTIENGLLPLELQGIRINDAVFAAVPAEVFVEIGLRLKETAPYQTFIVGIANGYIGYLPTTAAHAAGGYEVVSSKCQPHAEDVLVEGIVNLEKRLFRNSGKPVE
jgi:hypothetical protein